MYKIMKKLLYISFLALVAVFFIQCDSEDDLVTEDALEGGLVDISSTAINYVVGSGGTYTFDLFVHQEGAVKVNTINIYKSCYRVSVAWSSPDSAAAVTDSLPNRWSDEILDFTMNVTETGKSHSLNTFDWSWDDLRTGLTIDGGTLPVSDGEMNIGDYFNLVVEAELSDGRIVKQAIPVKMTVSTRYAGTYKFIEGVYYRLSVLSSSGDYWFETYQFESIDAITYRMVGLSAWLDNELFFQIDGAGKITYPAKWNGNDQILNGEPLITCIDNPGDMTNVPCGPTTNIVVNDDIGGKDRLYMSFGYLTGGSGPREFYQVMEKVPN
jgi:hypothetical protein